MAIEEGKAASSSSLARRLLDPHDELLVGISDLSQEIYERLHVQRIDDPRPRHFIVAGCELRDERLLKKLPEVPAEVVVGTFMYLIPDFER